MISKVIITFVLVNLLVVSCLAATTKEIKKPNGRASHHVHYFPERSDLDIENMIKQIQNYLPIIKNIMADPKTIGSMISKKICTSEDHVNAAILNGSLKFLIEKLIAKQNEQLSDVPIPQFPNLKKVYNDKINFSDLTFKKTILKGLENLTVSKFNYNICALFLEIEMNIPKLEIISTYSLNGTMDGSPIFGDGEIIVTVDMLKLHKKPTVGCGLNAFMDNTCELSYKNETDLTTEKVTVRMTNIKYQDLTESQINDKINKFIDGYNKSNIMSSIKNTVKLVKDHMKKVLDRYSPASLFEQLYNGILVVE